MPKPLRLGYVSTLTSLPLLVGAAKGWFTEAGLRLEPSPEIGWAALRRRLALRELAGAVVPISFPLMLPDDIIYGQLPLRAAVVTSFHGFTVVIGHDLLYRLAQPVFSGPIRIAGAGGFASCGYLLREWLRLTGRAEWLKHLVEVPVAVSQMNMYLEDGELDLVCGLEPWGSFAVRRGLGQCLCAGLDLAPLAPSGLLVFNPELVVGLPDFEAQVIAQITRAAEWCSDSANVPEMMELLTHEGWNLDEAGLKAFIFNETPGHRQSNGFMVYRVPGRDNRVQASDLAFALRYRARKPDDPNELEKVLARARLVFGEALTLEALKREPKGD